MLEVKFHPRAEADLADLYDYIERRGGPYTAGAYIERIHALCEKLAMLPYRGVPRDDLAPDLRTISMSRRVLMVYRPTAEAVTVLRVLHAGRDFGAKDLPI